MDAITPKCLLDGCTEPVPETKRGRPQRFCCDAHRKAHSRLNGHENRSDRQSYPGGENIYFAPTQPLDIVEAVCPFNQEQTPTRRRARSSKGLRFEEHPPRQKKTDRCITYKLTDGEQINTGYGRTSRPLGYVMEIHPGRWVARVNNLSGATLPLGAAKKAAIELRRRRDKGRIPEDRDRWINANNMAMSSEIDRAALEADRKRESKRWPTNLLGGGKRRKPCKLVTKEDRELVLADEIPEFRETLRGGAASRSELRPFAIEAFHLGQ